VKNLLILLHEIAHVAIKRAFPELVDDLLVTPDLVQTTHAQFGHYQCNNALKIGSALQIAPRQVAEKIRIHFALQDSSGRDMIEKLEIAGPGFININLKPEYLEEDIQEQLLDEHLGVAVVEHPQKIVVEFSSPNVAKEMHVGHIRSTIIGDCIARVLEFLRHDVVRLNHIGDWGTQFGMLITHMKDLHIEAASEGLEQLMGWYREAKIRFDADPEFKKRAQLQVVKLQRGDPESLLVWESICAISRRGFQEIYDLLDVKILERGESFYNSLLPSVIHDFAERGLLTLSEGAKCIFMEGFVGFDGSPLPMIIQKADGGYNYDTTDLAALKHRVKVEKADRIIIVTDVGQALHFQMLFKAGALVGYYDPDKVQLDHVVFGVVLGPDGKKFKTRSGETEKLIDLLLRAITKAKGLLHERMPDLSDVEIQAMAHVLGIDAVKYADLSCHRIKDYLFSYDRMLGFEGNTAAFLLYSYVRVQGIKRKIGRDVAPLIGTANIRLQHPAEIALALHLRQFGEALFLVARDLLPNRLTDYLYVLAEKFNLFFRDCRVEGDPYEDSRLLLCELTGRILARGLQLLGLKTLDRM
jgi:arginyl-tRNA synthetase